MNRRTFFFILVTCGAVGASFGIVFRQKWKGAFRYARARISRYTEPIAYQQRKVVLAANSGESISVEMAMNSRCTSDADGSQARFHWGLLDKQTRLPQELISQLVSVALKCNIMLPDGCRIRVRDNTLTFLVVDQPHARLQACAMIQCGMLQQAIGLLCSAFGIGYRFKDLGPSGKRFDRKSTASVNIMLDPMKPSYGQSFWTDTAPAGKAPWTDGNLPHPRRDGDLPLVEAFTRITSRRRNGSRVRSMDELGQLLWACRGRTPHLYLSKPWGMTIPVYKGKQDRTYMQLRSTTRIYAYENWQSGCPTHSIAPLGPMQDRLSSSGDLDKANLCEIVWGTNGAESNALWEVGYQALNFILQAVALGISFEISTPEQWNNTSVTSSIGAGPKMAAMLRLAPEIAI